MDKFCKCGEIIEPKRVFTKCKSCAAKYWNEYRIKNRERINQQRKETYQLKVLIKSRKENKL